MNDLYALADKLLEDILADGGVLPSSRDLAELMATKYPKQIKKWLREEEIGLLSDALTRRLGHKRRQMHRTLQATRILEGDGDLTYDIASIWSTSVHIPDIGHKALGYMDGADHFAVAADHEKAAHRNTRVAEVHKEIGQNVGLNLTRNVYDPETILKLWEYAYGEKERSAV